MRTNLVYNSATGVWSPAPELRPVRQPLNIQKQPLLVRAPQAQPIPPMPAPPQRPRQMRLRLTDTSVQGPQTGQIPLRPPYPLRPDVAKNQLPQEIREQGRWGQIHIAAPGDVVTPKPNLPNLPSFDKKLLETMHQKFNFQRMTSGGRMPEVTESVDVRSGPGKVNLNDLKLPRRVSNSPFAAFGNNVGRNVY